MRRLAAQFKGATRQRVGAGLQDRLRGRALAGKTDLGDVGMGDPPGAGVGAVAGHHIADARRTPRRLEPPGERARRRGRRFGSPEERRAWKEWGSTCRSRWAPAHSKKKK